MSWVERDAQDYTSDHDYGTVRKDHLYAVCVHCGRQIYSGYGGRHGSIQTVPQGECLVNRTVVPGFRVR